MNIQELEAFWWIAQTGSFNRAAQKLFLTQPSVTARIQSLEKELGQSLFQRRPRGVLLTEAGRALLPHAQRVIQDIRRARQVMAGLLRDGSGTLALGCSRTAAAYLLPEMLTRFKARHPEFDITVRTGRAALIQQLVLDGSLQLGLVHGPLNPHPEAGTVVLAEERLVLVAHPQHPLAGAPCLTAPQLVDEPFITPDRSLGFWPLVEQFWASAGLVPRVIMETDSVEAAKRMVRHNLGVTVLPVTCVDQELANGALTAVPLAGSASLERQLLLIHRRDRAWSAAARSFLGVAEGICALRGGRQQSPA